MNYLRNSVTIIGNLGFDPEFKELKNGNSLAKIRVATNEYYKDANGDRVERTQWHSCVAFGKKAESMKMLLKKGKGVAVQGKLNHRSYEDKDGIKRYVSEIIINDFFPLERKKEQELN